MNPFIVFLFISSISNLSITGPSKSNAESFMHFKSPTAGSEAHAVVETPKSTADPDSHSDRDSLYVIADLDDGSRIIGVCERAEFPITTRYAKLEIPIAMVQTIEFV